GTTCRKARHEQTGSCVRKSALHWLFKGASTVRGRSGRTQEWVEVTLLFEVRAPRRLRFHVRCSSRPLLRLVNPKCCTLKNDDLRRRCVEIGIADPSRSHAKVADSVLSSTSRTVRRSEERRVGKECRSRWSP